MPSPLGHAVAGATVGLLVAGQPGGPWPERRRELWRWGILFAVLGMLPDLDLLLPLEHRAASHSLAAAVVAGLAVAGVSRQGRLGLAAGAAYASHALLDWLGTDTSPPIGLMVLWPFTSAYYESGVHLFGAISRRYWLEEFWLHNIRALGWELLVLLPPAVAVLWLRLFRRAPGHGAG